MNRLVAFLLAAAPLLAQSPEQLEQLLKRYPAADANKDGKLTLEEAREYRAKNLQRERPSPQRAKAPAPTHANVHYGEHERQVLDFWKAESDKPTPVLVFIHGGGFVGGSKDGVNPGTIEMARKEGVSFASINYRYTTQAPYPAPMLDGGRAIQFLRSKAAEWNIDPKRIGAFGGSAGAGISMWLAFHDDLSKPDSSDPVERQSSRLTCAGSIGGQSSYDPLQIKEWLGGNAWRHPAFIPFYAVKSADEFSEPRVRKLAFDASVINHLTKDDGPIFFFYSEPDGPLSETDQPGKGIHHPKFAHILREKMTGLGIESVYRHAGDGRQPSGQDEMQQWLIAKLTAPVK